MPHVITITGASRAGKSTTVDYLQGLANKHFKPKLVRKYTTRDPRSDDEDEEVRCVDDKFPDECDLVYEQYGKLYGLKLQTLVDCIAQGRSPIVILNDVRAVEDVRSAFRERVRSIFIFRHDPLSKIYHEELIESRGVGAGKIRFEKARTIYRIYIENIHLFDHVIINDGTFDELKMQVKQVVRGLG
jgi:guanylate kinase